MNDAGRQGRDAQSLETRVLVLAPTAKDGELTRAMLARASIACMSCGDAAQVCEQLKAGAGAVLVAEEAVHGNDGCLAAWVERQPAWSDLPVLVLARAGADSPAVARAMDLLGNVTIVERPTRVATLVSVVRSALRARRRQYQLHNELVQRQQVAEQLNLAMAAADAGSWQVSLKSGVFSASARAIALHGLPPGSTLRHETALACVHPDDRASVEAALRMTFERGQPFRHEHRVPQPDGSLRWVASRAERHGQGDQASVVGLVQDITERRQAEDALRYSENLHRIAFDQSPTGMAYVGVDGRFMKVNSAMCEIAGYAAEELLGMRVSDITHPADRARDAELLAPFLSGSTPSYENQKRYVRKDGAVRWVAVAARMVTDAAGRPLHTVGVSMDITARMVAQEESKHAQRQIATTLESITDAFTRFDRDWRVVFLNDAAERMNQRSRAETLGKTVWELFPALLGTQVETEYRRCVAEQVPVDFDFHFTQWDSWFAIRGYPAPEGGLVASIRDITDAKRAGDALRQSESRFRAGIQAVSDIVWTNDARGMMAGEQLAWQKFTGQELESYQGYGWSSAIHPEDSQPTVDAWNEAIAGKKTFAFEHRVRRHDGEWRMCSVRAVPVLDERGAIREWVGVHSDITDRVAAEAALRLSEERFRTLFESMDEGFCVIEMAFDEAGRATDYRTIEMNPAFAKHTGMGGLLGRWLRQALPDLEEFWYETYGRVATTGVATRFVHAAGPMDGRWFDVNAFRLGGAGSNKVAILFNDVTASRRAQDTVMESEARNSFLVTLADTLRALSDPLTVKAEASRLLGQRLGASRVAYFEVQDGDYVVERDYTDAAPSIVGCYPIASFGPAQLAMFRAGRTAIESDVAAMSAQPPEVAAAFASLQVRSYVAVPLIKSGTFVAGLAVHAGTARAWTPTELAIVEDTAERTWAAVERVRAEAALRISEERRRLALEAAELGTWHVDPSTRRTQTDERFRAIFGTTDEWMDYLQLFAVMHPDDLPAVEAAVAAAMQPDDPQPYAIEYRIHHADGGLRWVFAKGRATFDEGKAGRHAVRFDGTVLDITERKRAEQALRDSEARLGGILRRSPAGIIQTDAAGRMTLVNPRWLDMTGLSEPELLGRNILDITHPSFVAPTAAAFEQLAAGGPDFQIEKAYLRKDGSILRAQSNVAAIRSPSGEFLGLIAVILDITERLRAEDELRRLAAKLSEADRRKDVFLATLAHELRNPLAPIRNGLQVMKLSKNEGQVLERTRAMMERQVTQLVRLVDDLLDVSRITQGKVELRKARVSLNTVIDAAVETSRSAIEEAGHALVAIMPDEPIFVDADAARLSQVVSNLLHNSAKYTHRGGRIRLTVGLEAGTALVSVKDNGIGIPPAMLDKVFVMFTQVDRTLEKTTRGLGIGLSLVKALLEMHGATIEAKSDGEGMGSEFVVRLPVAMVAVAESDLSNGQALEVAPSALRRILVVDDNVDSADSLGQLLEMFGNEVRTANDGAAALEAAAQFRPDVVLMDIGMPKLNGYEAARRMRQQSWGQGMVLVALTGWGQEDDRKKSAAAGFDHHLVKPVQMDDLTRLMSALEPA